MKTTIYQNDEFEIFVDDDGSILRLDSPYPDGRGVLIEDHWYALRFNPHDGGPSWAKIPMESALIRDRLGYEVDESTGKVYGPRECFFLDMENEHGTEAAEALCKYFHDELEQAERNFKEAVK